MHGIERYHSPWQRGFSLNKLTRKLQIAITDMVILNKLDLSKRYCRPLVPMYRVLSIRYSLMTHDCFCQRFIYS